MEDQESVNVTDLSGKTAEDTSGGNKSSGLFDELLDWVESFVFAGFVVLLILIFLFRTVVVDGASMNPTLYNSQRLLLEHFNYTPERGDIIVANCPGLNKTIIKRCIGIEGDTVVIDYAENSVTVNGEKVDESYLGEPMVQLDRFDETYRVSENKFEYVVPDDCVFAMGDNRNASRDSRYSEVGFISNDDVLGKAVFRFYVGTDGSGQKNPGKIGFLN